MSKQYDVVIIGGGPAGLSAAETCWEKGLKNILIVERDKELGGILNQCIHNGFGLHLFKEELTGPEFAGKFIEKLKETGVEIMLDTMVLNVDTHQVEVINTVDGYQVIDTRAIILAMGCRERTRGAIAIPGTRAAGVFTAGTAQRYMNIDGELVGKRVVILGSGDIGLIMARRMTLEGAKVLACVEINPYSGGLARNIAQCLNDFNIPLYLSHTITDIRGKERVTGVTISQVDDHFQPIKGTEMDFDCDTVLLSVGLIPENELSIGAGVKLDRRTRGPIVYENMETSIPGVFACGNVVHVHDLADNVAMEARKAALGAVDYVNGVAASSEEIEVTVAKGITYSVPQHIHKPFTGNVDVFFRVNRNFGECEIRVTDSEDKLIARFKRPYVVPGSMEKITLPKVLLEKATGNIKVEVAE